jgi:hypothetical protein
VFMVMTWSQMSGVIYFLPLPLKHLLLSNLGDAWVFLPRFSDHATFEDHGLEGFKCTGSLINRTRYIARHFWLKASDVIDEGNFINLYVQ